MFKHTVKYTDFDGNERTEDLYFHLSPAEMTQFQYSVKGGMKNLLEKATQEQDGPTLMKFFVKMVEMAYGRKSNDGRRFEKSYEIYQDFAQTNAYNALFMQLVTDEGFAKKFTNAVFPDMEQYAAKSAAGPQLTAGV